MSNQAQLRKTFEFKESSIVVAYPNGTIRGQITAILKELGFKTILGGSEISDIVAILQDSIASGKPPGWIFTSMYLDAKANALQLQQLLTSTPELKQIACSFITAPDEEFTIPLAVERGLLSWHPAESFTQGDAIRKEINSLFSIITRHDFNPEMVAMTYACSMLRSKAKYEELKRLSAVMLEFKSDNPYALLGYADALALNGDLSGARRYATQAVWSNKELIAQAGWLKSLDQTPIFTPSEIQAMETKGTSLFSAFGIQKCIILDPDEAARKHLRNVISSMGIQEIVEFDNGLSAWEHLEKNHHNTIMICEWKLPGLSGMALLQRMQQAGIHDVPVIISSAQLGQMDVGLVEELGSAVLLQKPLTMESLESDIRTAMKEEHLPSSFKGVIRKIRHLLRKHEIASAKKIWEASAAQMVIPGIHRRVISSEILLAEAKLEDAYAEAIAAERLGAKGAYFFNLLGKISFALGDFDGSASWFEKANEEVAINIERLTDMAAVELHRGDTGKAAEVTASAASIDAMNPKVLEAQALVALEKGDSEDASAVMAQLNDLMNIVGHLNNRAVAMAWKGDHDRGISLYREALSAAPKSAEKGQKSFAPFVTYNLALALARKGEFELAEKTISGLDPLALATVEGRLSMKVSGFKSRIKEAINTGKKIEIETPKTSDVLKKRILNLHRNAINAKSANLVKELKVLGTIDYRALKLVEKALRFNPKKT